MESQPNQQYMMCLHLSKSFIILFEKNFNREVRKLNKQTLQSIAYVQNALSFVFLDLGIGDAINRVYLYGSAVRGELGKDSDVDIFIDCEPGKEKAVEGIAKSAFSRFYHSKD